MKYGTKIDLNIRTHSKLTALEMSIKFNENGEVVKQLLTLSKQNVSFNCLDKEGLSLLHYACRNRNAEVVEELLENGANPNLKSSCLQKTKSPLHYVFEYGCGDESISIEKHNEIISIMNCLLNYGSDIEARNTDGETALYKASVWGNIPAVKFLLENGATITYGHTNSALHDAAGYGDTEMIELLVNHNADINKMISNKGTPLYRAIIHGKCASVEKLLELGADVNATSSRIDSSPLQMACNTGHLKIVKELLRHGAKTELCDQQPAIHRATSRGNLDIVKELLKHGAQVDVLDRDGNTALQIAAISGDVRIVRELLKNGANVNAKTMPEGTVLHFAIDSRFAQRLDAIQAILEDENVDLNIKDNENLTPFEKAMQMNHLKIAKMIAIKMCST